MFGAMRVEVVPDNDADADPRIPNDVLANLAGDTVLMNATMMYVRATTWEQIKRRFICVARCDNV
jgi:hypothetical protein